MVGYRDFTGRTGFCVLFVLLPLLGSSAAGNPYCENDYGCGLICTPNAANFGYFPKRWREWPTERRPDKKFPQSIGGEVVPTPQGTEELPLPKRQLVHPPAGAKDGLTLPTDIPWEEPGQEQALPDLPLEPGMPLEPAEGQLPGLPLEPEEGQMPGLPSEPKEGQLPGLPLEPAEGEVPESPFVPEEGGLPGMPLEPESSLDKTPARPPAGGQLPGLPLEPESRAPVRPPTGRYTSALALRPEARLSVRPMGGSQLIGSSPTPVTRVPGGPRTAPPTARLTAPPPGGALSKSSGGSGGASGGQPRGTADTQPSRPQPAIAAEDQAPTVRATSPLPIFRPREPAETFQEDAPIPDERSQDGRPISANVPSAESVRQVQYEAPIDSGKVEAAADTDRPPLALDGYCPVALSEKENWVPGQERWMMVYEGLAYRFSGPRQRQRFMDDPGRYAPAMSGFDPVLALEKNRWVRGKTDYCIVYQRRLYAFSSAASSARFRQAPDHFAAMAHGTPR